jgi:MFS family permease
MTDRNSGGAATVAEHGSGTAASNQGAFQSFSRQQIASVLLIGVMSSLVVVLQPLLLAPLATEGRLTLQEIGRAAMLEMLGMAIGVAISGAFFAPRKLRAIIIGALLVSILANGVASISQHGTILAARFVNGFSVGVLLWVWTGLVTRVELPARLVAIFLALQSAGALALSTAFSAYVIPRVGAAGGYVCLGVASALAALLVIGAPKEYHVVGSAESQRFHVPSRRGWVGLLAVVMHKAGIMAFWVYVLPLGREQGLSDSFIGIAISAALVAQIAGGLSAALFARLSAKIALCGSIAASIGSLVLLGSGAGPATFMISVVVLVFLWMFAPPFQMPYLLEVDPSRRAGMQMITAQLLGLSMGPALASLVVQETNIEPALWVSGALYASGAVLIIATTMLRPAPRRG